MKICNIIHLFKLITSLILIGVIFLLILKLMNYIIIGFLSNPLERFSPEDVRHILGDILLVFISIELLRTVYIYITKQEVCLQALFEASLVAILRKIIEVESLDPFYSLSILFFVLTYVYFKQYK